MKARRLAILILIAFSLLFVNLLRMQVLKGGYYRALSERNRVRVIYLEGPRGRITDRNGIALAENRLSFNCSVIPYEAKKTISESCRIAGTILRVDADELERRFKKRKPGNFNTVILAEDIPASQAMSIEEKIDQMPGFMIETRPRRTYPVGEAAAHAVGYIGPMTKDEVERFDAYGYRRDDWVGRDGVERSYESYLHGTSGGLQIEVDSRGRLVRALGVKEPEDGQDMQLTLDSKLQTHVQRLLSGKRGAVAVMELGEGGILSLNSAPSFDPNLFSSAAGRRDVGKYIRGKGAPMLDRAIRSQYPPGSIFKVVTALAALKKNKINSHVSVNCPGYFLVGGKRFGCWHEAGHGPQAMTEAFSHSCNVFFYTAGVLAGVDAIAERAVQFGFSKATGIDLPHEKKGFVPSREWKRRKTQMGWFDGETANLAIGQGYLEVTPMQALVMIGATATRGQVLRPHLVDKIGGVKAASRSSRSMDVPADDWNAVRAGLDAVVNSDTGTGRLSRVPGVRIHGKTGTAQSGQNQTHAWFVGYAPADRPKVAVVVFIENGGRGGVAAATLAQSVFAWLKEASYL